MYKSRCPTQNSTIPSTRIQPNNVHRSAAACRSNSGSRPPAPLARSRRLSRAEGRLGSGADERCGSKISPLLRGKRSPHVGFRRPAKFSADQFPHSGVKLTLSKVADFVCLYLVLLCRLRGGQTYFTKSYDGSQPHRPDGLALMMGWFPSIAAKWILRSYLLST